VTRVLYFSRDYSTHDHRFLSALANTNHQVFYLRLEKRGHPLEDRPLPPSIEQVDWEGGQRAVRLSDAPRLLVDLRRVIQTVQPELIQAGPIQRSAFLTALVGFKPLVSMSWGYDLLYDAKRSPFWRWATKFTLKRSAALVGDCQTIHDAAVSYGMAADRIVIFPWGVDIEHFIPGEMEPGTGNTFTLLSTRAWEPIYGSHIVAQAFANAARKRPELRLIMLGHGSLAADIEKIFNAAGVRDRVNFPGQVKQADLPCFYHKADLYISASYSDGTSISLLEAIASGRPALVSDIPGNREWITPGVNGWLFSTGDAGSLEEAILNAFEKRKQLAEMGKAARSLAEERADWRKNFPELMKAYQLALHRKS
jgi:glycosyltransferase involved in cell wall biosynthesis